jgi:hypothetical protein
MSFVCTQCIDHEEFCAYAHDSLSNSKCDNCGAMDAQGIDIETMAELIDPIFRNRFAQYSGYPDSNSGGDDLLFCIHELFEKELPFAEEIISALEDTEFMDIKDGGDAFYSSFVDYERIGVIRASEQIWKWREVLRELKYEARFFSPRARELFSGLFGDIEQMVDKNNQPVVLDLNAGAIVYRARKFKSLKQGKEFEDNPEKHIGPVPSQHARNNRMSPENVSYMYTSFDRETCAAELRPAIGEHIMVAGFETTRALRLLDFRRLETASFTKDHSIFHPDYFKLQGQRALLRHLHHLISMPVVPGNEADYLITQTMAEYLAHVHESELDGIVFRSAQKKDGVNIVIFPAKMILSEMSDNPFKVRFRAETVHAYRIEGVTYSMTDVSKDHPFESYEDDFEDDSPAY